MLGVVLPTGGQLGRILPTYLCIAIVSLLDDALEELFATAHPESRAKKLRQRIGVMEQDGSLNDPERLHEILNMRNAYAHDPDSFASWDDLTALLEDVSSELRHLGVL